jgi:nitroreductase
MLKDLILKNRSYCRFDETIPITRETLVTLVDLARCSASGGNKQTLKYIISFQPEKNALIFPNLAWAGYLEDWQGPEAGERPGGYIVIVGDTEISQSFGVDHGIAAQSILLGATEMGYGGCMIASIRKQELRQVLEISPRYEILLVIALGKPIEKVVLEKVNAEGDIRYWRDANGVHHVPKRSLEEILLE